MRKSSKMFSIDYDEDGFIGCMPVDALYTQEHTMINPSEKIIRANTITIVYDYPLSVEVKIRHTRIGGWTRRALYNVIREDYTNIYKTEEETAGGDPGHIPGMLNRAQSNGDYGIWGHDIGDLVIEGIRYSEKTKTVHLEMGS